MCIINKCIESLRNLIHKIRFLIKLKQMDDWWYFVGGSSWQLFPPSFYYTHTEEEIKRITDGTLSRLQTMVAKFEARNQPTE